MPARQAGVFPGAADVLLQRGYGETLKLQRIPDLIFQEDVFGSPVGVGRGHKIPARAPNIAARGQINRLPFRGLAHTAACRAAQHIAHEVFYAIGFGKGHNKSLYQSVYI